ncbi:MAG: Crp/Fnr family transcriptional regulator [Parvibaculum sp.]
MAVASKAWTKDRATEFLSREGWLKDQPADFRNDVFRRGKILRLSAGAAVFHQGDEPPSGIYAVLEGNLFGFYYLGEDEKLLLWTIAPGAWFGEAVLFDRAPRPFEVSAATEASLFFLPTAGFNDLISADPRNYLPFAKLLTENLRSNFRGLVSARLSARERAARAFLRLARAHGRPADTAVTLDVHLSQSDIASLVGVSRQYMNELLADWQKEGLIEVTGGIIRIPVLARLEALANRRPAGL